MPRLWTRVADLAKGNPERLALVEGSRRVTYGALWRDVEVDDGNEQLASIVAIDRPG